MLRRDLISDARQLYTLSEPLRRHAWHGYAIGAVLAILSIIVRRALGNWLNGIPFITVFPAITATSFACGWRAGTFCAAMGGFLACYYLLPPFESIGLVWPSGFLALLFLPSPRG